MNEARWDWPRVEWILRGSARPRNEIFARALGLTLATLLLAASIACQPNATGSSQPDAWVTIRGDTVSAEIADTPEKQALGLGDRDDLAWDHGMLFPYDRPQFQAFWMKRMRFPIDIVWILDNRIVKIDANVPFEPGGNGPTIRSDTLIDAVLEVPAGYAVARGWQPGDKVVIERRQSDR